MLPEGPNQSRLRTRPLSLPVHRFPKIKSLGLPSRRKGWNAQAPWGSVCLSIAFQALQEIIPLGISLKIPPTSNALDHKEMMRPEFIWRDCRGISVPYHKHRKPSTDKLMGPFSSVEFPLTVTQMFNLSEFQLEFFRITTMRNGDCSGSQETEFRSQNGNTGDEV